MLVWLNGRLVSEAEAQVSAFDHGLTVGDGVFETVKVVDGVPFALERHLQRLGSSARGLGLAPPDAAEVRRACGELLAARPSPRPPNEQPLSGSADNRADLRRLRITYTSGRGPLGSERSVGERTLIVALAPLAAWPPTVRAVTAPWPRNERGALVGLKTTSYADNVIALAWAHARDASEALMSDTRGMLCEGTGSNVFVVVDGQVLTPALSTGCLPGITRALVLEWCGGEEVEIAMSVLQEADEMFLTSSTRDVQSLHAVDSRRFPAPGPVTIACAAEFARRSAETFEP